MSADVMLGVLKLPDAFARSGLEAHDARSEEFITGTVSAVVVVRWRAEREIDVPQLFINGERSPRNHAARRVG
jgi:hypothetical protein